MLCSGKKRKTHDEYVEEVKINNPNVLVLETYMGADTPIKHQCGHCNNDNWIVMPWVVLKGGRCRKCAYDNRKIDLNLIKQNIESLGYVLISKEIKYAKDKIIFKDNERYLYYMKYSNMKWISTPQKFGKSNPYTIQNIKLWCILNNKPFELLSEIYVDNSKKIKWKCLIDSCGEVFDTAWSNIYNGQGCGVCAGMQVRASNCLATKNPDLAKEWHPTKNGELTPYDVTSNNDKMVWWLCKNNLTHEWKSIISSRNSGSGCPYCIGYLPSEEYNLLYNNPKLCEEWDYKKNAKPPSEYTPNSSYKVWWLCKECKNSWCTTIAHRSSGRGCPECSKSKGEKSIKLFFLNNKIQCIEDYTKIDDICGIYYIAQKEFDGLLGIRNGNLSYDFYLPKIKLAIEYQGEFHDGTAYQQSAEEFEIQKEHDFRKKVYANNHGIRLLEIWYWDFNNIEEILNNELKYLNYI